MCIEASWPLDRAALSAALRARLARGTRAARDAVPVAEGITPRLDRATLHEVVAGDADAALGFCAMLLGRAGGPVVWIGPAPSGFGRYGLSPASLVVVPAARGDDALWAMEEALRCPALGGVLLRMEAVPTGAAARLMVAAETGGTLGLLLRQEDATPLAEVATRWRISALAGAGALGDPRWSLALLRGRAETGQWEATWRASLDRLDVDTPEPPEAKPKRIRRAPSGR